MGLRRMESKDKLFAFVAAAFPYENCGSFTDRFAVPWREEPVGQFEKLRFDNLARNLRGTAMAAAHTNLCVFSEGLGRLEREFGLKRGLWKFESRTRTSFRPCTYCGLTAGIFTHSATRSTSHTFVGRVAAVACAMKIEVV